MVWYEYERKCRHHKMKSTKSGKESSHRVLKDAGKWSRRRGEERFLGLHNYSVPDNFGVHVLAHKLKTKGQLLAVRKSSWQENIRFQFLVARTGANNRVTENVNLAVFLGFVFISRHFTWFDITIVGVFTSQKFTDDINQDFLCFLWKGIIKFCPHTTAHSFNNLWQMHMCVHVYSVHVQSFMPIFEIEMIIFWELLKSLKDWHIITTYYFILVILNLLFYITIVVAVF